MASAEKETKSNCDRNSSIRIIALHKLYQDDGISYYPSKSTSIFEQGSAGSGTYNNGFLSRNGAKLQMLNTLKRTLRLLSETAEVCNCYYIHIS